MNRSQLINILAQKTGLNKKDVKRTIDEMQTNCPGSQRRSKNLPAWFRLIQTSFSIQPPSTKPEKRYSRTAVSQDHHSFQMRSPPVGADEQIKNKKETHFYK